MPRFTREDTHRAQSDLRVGAGHGRCFVLRGDRSPRSRAQPKAAVSPEREAFEIA
jgi:hypothetical protein